MKIEKIRIAALNIATKLGQDSVDKLIEQSKQIEDYINAKREFTTDDIDQFVIASKSVEHFAALVDIQCPTNGVIKIIPNTHQQLMFKLIASESIMLFDMPRQKGTTTGLLIYALHRAIFHEYRTIVIVANKYDQAKEFTRRLREMLISIDNRWFNIIKNNVTELEFENGSRIIVLTPNRIHSTKGLTLTDVIVDQAGFISNADTDEILNSLWPVIYASKSSKMIFAASGMGEHSESKFLENLYKNQNVTVLKMLQ